MTHRAAMAAAGLVGVLVGALLTFAVMTWVVGPRPDDVATGPTPAPVEPTPAPPDAAPPASPTPTPAPAPTPAPPDTIPTPTPTPTPRPEADEGYVYESPVVGRVEIPPGYPTPATTGLAGLGIDADDLPVYDGPDAITDTRTIEGMRIESTLVVDGGDLTIRGSHIESDASEWVLHTTNGGALTIEDSTVRADNGKSHTFRGPRITIRRSDIRQGTTVAQLGNRSEISDSFIADAGMPDDEEGHHDGVQILNAKEGVTVRRNTILSPFQSQNSAIHVQSHKNWSGVRDVVIEDNFLSGGNYTMYLEAHEEHGPLEGAVVRRNVWNADSWRHGPVSRSKLADDLVWEDNHLSSGDAIE